MKKIKVAIDGPAGAGKSTVARSVARELSFLYIDTGAMYRALTWKALKKALVFNDAEALTEMANQTDVILDVTSDQSISVYVDGEDVTEAIREPVVSQHVSYLAKVAGVRKAMVSLQRQMARDGGVVMDGRDIGTFVLPDAECKVFLTASPEERARRRYSELTAKGFEIDYQELLQEMIERDRIDSEREVAPLVPAEDAQIIDSTGKTIEQVISEIIDLCRRVNQ